MFPYMQARNIPWLGTALNHGGSIAFHDLPNAIIITVAQLQEMRARAWTIVPHQTVLDWALKTWRTMRAEIVEDAGPIGY